MNPHSPIVATKYCFLVFREDTSFFFLIISLFFVFFLLFYVIINFYKNYFIIIILLYIYISFHKDYFYFSCSGMFWDVPGCSEIFRDVPGCSRMFRNVPGCSMFWVLSTPAIPRNISFKNQSNNESLWKPTFGYGKSILLLKKNYFKLINKQS